MLETMACYETDIRQIHTGHIPGMTVNQSIKNYVQRNVLDLVSKQASTKQSSWPWKVHAFIGKTRHINKNCSVE